MMSTDVAGVVLAGGKSTRLGTDKALLTLYPHSSRTLLERTVALLTPFVDTVWVSGRQVDYAPFLPDAAPGAGPIGGILAGLQAAPVCCVLACDVPLLQPLHLARLFAAREQRDSSACVTAFQNAYGRFETTVAIYEQAALPYLQQAVKRKEYALHKAVPPEHWVGVPYNEDEANAFLNLNTPDDLARVRLLLESFIVDCCSQKNMQMHQVASLK